MLHYSLHEKKMARLLLWNFPPQNKLSVTHAHDPSSSPPIYKWGFCLPKVPLVGYYFSKKLREIEKKLTCRNKMKNALL
jgi:hypothetical protein